MVDVEKSLKIAMDLCHQKNNYSYFNKLYAFATESINSYLYDFDLKDKKLLTVGSSFDQSINACLQGCYDQTIVDIDPFTAFYAYLKIAGLITLNYYDFINFFCYSQDSLNFEVFNALKSNLEKINEDAYHFWNTLYKSIDPLIIRNYLFNWDEEDKDIIIKINTYLKNEKSYKKAQVNIENIKPNFINSNLLTFNPSENYDNIFLSNVAQYLKLIELKCLVEKLDKKLNDDGKMLVCYLYDFINDVTAVPVKNLAAVYNIKAVQKILGKDFFVIKEIVGIENYRRGLFINPDAILIHQKKRIKI